MTVIRFLDGPLMGQVRCEPFDGVPGEVIVPVAHELPWRKRKKDAPLYEKVRYVLTHTEEDEGWYSAEALFRMGGVFVDREGRA